MATAKAPAAPRRWRWVLGVLLIAVAAAIVALPWLLSTPPARRWIVSRANRVLAPARLELASLRLSWTAPAKLRGLVLRDAQGDPVIASETATWDRTLRQILFDRPRLGTLFIDGGNLDVERRADGSVDLYDALRPIIGKDPRTDLRIRISRSRLRFRIAGQHVPVSAEKADVDLDILPAPRLLSWRVKLQNLQGSQPESLEVSGQYDRWPKQPGTPGNLALEIEGHRWPFAIDAEGVETSGRLDGQLAMRRRSGLHQLSGEARLAELDVKGTGIPGEHVRVDQVSGAWQASESAKGWAVDKLDVAVQPSARTPARRAEGQLVAQWDGNALAIRRLDLKVETEQGQFIFPARGRYDRDRGELVLSQSTMVDLPAGIVFGDDALRVSGLKPGGKLSVSANVAGRIEQLARLARPSDDTREMPRGTWSANARVESTSEALSIAGSFEVVPLATEAGAVVARDQDRFGLTLNAVYPFEGDRFEIARLALRSRYGVLEGSGRVSDPAGRRLAELAGTFSPDWDAINSVLAERVEPAAHVSGTPRAWRVSGPLAGGSASDIFKSLEIELGLDLREADIYGMHVGPAPLVVKSRRGALAVDPIDTTINGGTMHLEPEITVVDGQTRLRLGPSTTLRDAEINDEVSRRFLSYVAPVLDRATRVHGRVSLALQEAVFPIGGESSKNATVEGQVVFQEVEFLPGPFADELFDLIGREDRPGLKLDQPVALSIADRRVYQRGLALPLGRVTRIELDGWVDFDRNLKLTASLPITPAMVGNAPVLSELVQGKRISVPISGTLKQPKIDRDAIDVALKDLGKSFLDSDAIKGAAEMLMRLRPRRDPNEPPPPTFRERMEQRKEQRKERRAQRRGNGG